ncbi:MAG: sigma-70 family RNA polymerase sigma factor [Leptothrix ochracea]|uniref:sigma-70 family RNA polymerase sigma factor n=1 Tax=Leptothrix ochracea TaxID=735331 RepID=UPI0034E239F8
MNDFVNQPKATLNRFLRVAIVAGVANAVRLHIERGDDLNARDADGQTPLMLAAKRNKPHICKLLLDAGADPLLCNSDGNNALAIANTAGARDVALLLESAFATDLENESTYPTKHLPVNADAISSIPVVELIDFDEDCASLDLSGWESEAELSMPVGNPIVLINASEVQKAISEYSPIDISAGWEDFEAFLPEQASPPPKAADAETRERLRSLLLRATREGSVPNAVIEDMTLNDDQTPNVDAESLLRMVINDLGAEADERHEYSTHQESFEVYVDPRETSDEEHSVDEALTFIDALESRSNDPLRLYQRDFQHIVLLTADEEIALGKAMEQGIETALDVLAGSITGIEAIVEDSQRVKSRTKPLRWMSSGIREDIHESAQGDSLSTSSESTGDKDSQDDSYENSPEDELSEFISNAERLWNIARSLETLTTADNATREALGSLGLSASYLLGLSESGQIAEHQPALALRSAMQTYRVARDRMSVANLKLVQSIAKKYLYSGMPLDDLLQEGNLGLLKSVERFDWRRGYRFSTYATWWIRQQVSRFVADKAKTIRVPVHVYEKVQRIEQVVRAFEIANDRVPTTAEVAELVVLSTRKVASYMQISGEPLPIHEIDIDSMIAIGSRDEYIARDPMDIASDHDLVTVVHKILRTLKSKEQDVLQMRFGIDMPDAMTLDEIGTRIGVTRERIRQIEAKAIRHMKHPTRYALLNALKDTNSLEPADEADDDKTQDQKLDA